jgi:hypothetical protein
MIMIIIIIKKKTERWDYNMCSNNCHETKLIPYKRPDN